MQETKSIEDSYTVTPELMRQMKDTLGVMLASAATIQNACRVIERNSPHASDALILGTIGDLKDVAGDLMEAWQDMDHRLAGYIIN